jgi:hypothetical protein
MSSTSSTSTNTTQSKIIHSKKKIQKSEPEICTVCMNNYTSIIRKKTVCKYCKTDTCSKCIERYLLDRHEDAHCLHCRVNYNDAALQEICTKTYIQHIYFKHRQEVLINRERANLPGLQDTAINERQKRNNTQKINELKDEINELTAKRNDVMTKYNKLYTEYYSKIASKLDYSGYRKQLDDLLVISESFNNVITDKISKINRIKWPATYGLPSNGETQIEPEKKKFIRRCTRDGCQGFLSTAWKCGICEFYSCSKCFITKTKKHDDHHICKKEDVETADMIKKDSKPCPNCGEFIMKTSGCFSKNTPILLWNRTTKMSQDIRIGDELLGDDGHKRTVLNTFYGIDTLYKIQQTSGMTYIVNSKHTLVLKYNNMLPIHSYIYNKLIKYKKSNFEYHIRIDDYIKLDTYVKQVLVGYKLTPYTESTIQVFEAGFGEYYGWKVDSNSKFLLKDSTVCHNCDQMFCITCQTPWSWTSGKVVTSGVIHNPHYYEWMKRNGGTVPRNPADVPCGGYPNAWEIRRMPKGVSHKISNKFFEFHRICQELQDISQRSYRSHIDLDTTNKINVKFLLGDFDEKHWGQLLAKNERKRKRDGEVQEIFAAFRMVAIELINRVQNYHSDDNTIHLFTYLPVNEAEQFINDLSIEIDALIRMINDALRNASITYSYSVPYITIDNNNYYSIKTKNFSDEVKKRHSSKKDEDNNIADTDILVIENKDVDSSIPVTPINRKKPVVAPQASNELTSNELTSNELTSNELTSNELTSNELADSLGEDANLQIAIAASLEL